jgi:signal transduction histidine kinase
MMSAKDTIDERRRPAMTDADDALPWSLTSDAFLEDVLVNLSHELRTPLAAAKGYTTSLLHYDERLTHDERRTMLGEIDIACDRLEKVISQTMQTIRVVRGLVVLHLQPLDLTEITRSVLMTMNSSFADRSFLFEPDLDETVVILGDEPLLREVIMQLLANARTFSPEGHAVTITVRVVEDHVEWSVEDLGNGIAPADLPHIFEPFYQGDTSLTRETRGLGLGLTFCQQVVLLHGGTIHVESQPGTGSRFWFTLPLERHNT